MYDYASTLSDLFNEDTCQKIEEKSHAVLIRDGDHRLIIQGSDQLHVLLAVSIIEDIVARMETNVSASVGHQSSAMLDKMLKRAYSHEGEAEDGFDWSTMPEEVKRAVLVSLLDNDEPEVTVVSMEGIVETPAGAAAAVVVSSSAGSTSAVSAATAVNVSNTLSSVTVSKEVDSPPKLDITNPAIQPLVKLATSKGYTLLEIENVLHNKTSKLKESEFLRILHTNRRLQSATSGQASMSSAFLQPVVLHDKNVNSAPLRSADESVCVYTSGQSPICSVTVSQDACLQEVGPGSMKGTNNGDVERFIEGDESITILLKSDEEDDSFEDDDDNKNIDVDNDVNARLMALSNESEILYNSAVQIGEQTQKNVAVKSGGGTRRKKKKRKKKQLSPDTTVHQEEEPPPTVNTGNDINELDCISLIPATKPAAVDKSNNVVFVSDSSDSETIDISEDTDKDTGSRKAVVCKEQREFACRKEVWNQFHRVHLNSNNSENKNHNPRQFNFPAPDFTSVPAVATGV